jgi:hypothetical protein
VLCDGAAYYNKLSLLQWLHYHSCPWHEEPLVLCASTRGSIVMLELLSTVTAPWSSNIKQAMLHKAACDSRLDVVRWLRAHGAEWPEVFFIEEYYLHDTMHRCWHVSTVEWALASGAGWLAWKCEDYTADKYEFKELK